MELIDFAKLSQGIVGLVDILGRLAESIERGILAGIRSGDAIRKSREQTRLRNLMVLTAHLYRDQLSLGTRLSGFPGEPMDVGDWEEVKFEIASIIRLLDRIEKYLLPGGDVLAVQYRDEYLQFLVQIEERKQILDYLYDMDYATALEHESEIVAIAEAYTQLREQLRELSGRFGEHLHENAEEWDDATSATQFEDLPYATQDSDET